MNSFFPGDNLMNIKPYVHCLDHKFKRKLCDYCFSSYRLKCCSNCKFMYYCNVSCQRNDWNIHKYECVMFKDKELNLLSDDQIRLYIRLLIKNEDKHTCDDKSLRTFSNLMDHVDNIKNDSKRLRQMYLCLQVIKKIMGEEFLGKFKSEELISIFGKMVINSLNISNDELTETLGSGLYLSAASLNHSCYPNCVIVFNGMHLTVKVLKEFSDIDKATIAYVDLITTREERQKNLVEQYYFKCECSRCLDNDWNEKMLLIYCENCKNRLTTINDLNGYNNDDNDDCDKESIENVSSSLTRKCEYCQSSNTIKTNDIFLCIQQVKNVLNKVDNMENVENLIKKLVKLLNIKSNQIENVYVIKLQELFMDLLIRKEKFQDAIEIAKKLIHSYELYLPKNHPFIGLNYFKIAKMQYYLGNFDDSLNNFIKAQEVLLISYGSESSIYKNLQDLSSNCKTEKHLIQVQNSIRN